MRGNIETIRFTAIISAIFAFLSYLVTLNIELAFFVPQWPWMSNSFVLTVCGGVFTSTLVVLFCEVQKYLSNKTNCEQYLFYQTMYLYSILFQMQKNVVNCQDHSKDFLKKICNGNIWESGRRKSGGSPPEGAGKRPQGLGLEETVWRPGRQQSGAALCWQSRASCSSKSSAAVR